MAQPLIEIFAPERRGKTWAAAARIHFPEGTVDVLAKAPQAVVAKHLARVQALLAYHRAPEVEEEGMPPTLRLTPQRPLGRRMARVSGEDEVGAFWDDIADVVSDIIGSDVAQGVATGLASMIPVAGAVIAGSGIVSTGMDAAAAAIDQAQNEGNGASMATAQRAAEQEARRAEEKAKRDRDAAKAANARRMRNHLLRNRRAMRGMVVAKKKEGKEGGRNYRGLLRAGETAQAATAGDPAAQQQVVYIIERAAEGDPAGIEATVMLSIMFEMLMFLMEEQMGEEYGEVGILGLEDRQLLAKLKELRLWKRHMRRLLGRGRGRRRILPVQEAEAKAEAATEAVRRNLARLFGGRSRRRAA